MTITNDGGCDGAEVVQAYLSDHTGLLQVPPQELRAFAKVRIRVGEQTRLAMEIARNDIAHYHPESSWVFHGGELELSVGSSSRDLRLRTTVEIPGHPVDRPLTLWSQLGEWFDHPVAGPMVRAMIEQGGGLRGRLADLLDDPVGRDSIRAVPMAGVTQFPGFPVSETNAVEILAEPKEQSRT